MPPCALGIRLRRVAVVGAAALLLSAFELLPLLLDGAIINHSRYEPLWKWDSLGALKVMGLLLSGDLLDHGRLPVLTILALVGIDVFVFLFLGATSSASTSRELQQETFNWYGVIMWIFLFFGRPFWGRLLPVYSSESFQTCRYIG